jgi:hypothetical protein
MDFTFDENIFSDLHKDARGFRPRGHEFYTASNERKQEIWDALLDELDRVMADDARTALDAQRRFEQLVAATISAGAHDRETAIRWILDAEGINASDAAYGGGAVCYHFGLCFQFADQFEAACRAIVERDGNPYDQAA